MRYVVRKQFFGLHGVSEKQKTQEKELILTTTPGQPNEKPLSEGDGANSQSGSSRRKGSLEQANNQDISKGERVTEEQINQKHDQVWSVKAWDSPASTGQAKRLNSEATVINDCQSLDLSSTDEFTLNIYDDEVWESPAAIV